METRAGLPVVAFPSAGEWEAWLEVQGPGAPGLWLRFPKKGSGITGLAHAEALDVALCFGWIDGQTAREDDRHWLQRFTPRGPRSTWSRLNRERALELIAEGRMRPGGLAAVEAARADGRWDRAYEPQSTAAVPDDLRRALAETPGRRRPSPASTAATATPCSTGSPARDAPRRARAAASRRSCADADGAASSSTA